MADADDPFDDYLARKRTPKSRRYDGLVEHDDDEKPEASAKQPEHGDEPLADPESRADQRRVPRSKRTAATPMELAALSEAPERPAAARASLVAALWRIGGRCPRPPPQWWPVLATATFLAVTCSAVLPLLEMSLPAQPPSAPPYPPQTPPPPPLPPPSDPPPPSPPPPQQPPPPPPPQPPLPPPLPPVPSPIQPYEIRDHKFGRFCSNHECFRGNQGKGSCCPNPCRLAPNATHHVVFLHVEKTGGTSIECATQQWQDAHYWTNMGHASDGAVRHCMSACEAASVPATRVMAIRNPYSYWRSIYHYAWQEMWPTSGHDPASSTAAFLMHESKLGLAEQKRVMSSFESFMEYFSSSHAASVVTLTHHLKLHCANQWPCPVDFLMRTESLASDWAELLRRYSLPPAGLPHVNEAGAEAAAWGPCPDPDAAHTDATRRAVNILEHVIFEHYNYTMEAPCMKRKHNVGWTEVPCGTEFD